MPAPDPADALGLAPMPLPALAERPLVSVLVSCYNYGAFVGEAIEGVLGQTYREIELIVVDDGSTDDSVAVARRYAAQDARVAVVAQANAGQAAAINAGVAACRGEVLCLLDADDVYEPGKVEATVALFRAAPRAGFAIHRVQAVDAAGRALPRDLVPWPLAQGWCAPTAVRAGGIAGRFPPTSALALRRDVARFLTPLDVRLTGSADGLWHRLAPLVTEIAASPEPLTRYRCHGQNMIAALYETPATIAKRLRDLDRLHDATYDFASAVWGEAVAERVASRDHDAVWLATRAWLALLDDAPPAERRAAATAVLRHPDTRDVQFRAAFLAARIWPALGAAMLRTAVTDNPVKRTVQWVKKLRAARQRPRMATSG